MRDALKYALIAIGGFWLYRQISPPRENAATAPQSGQAPIPEAPPAYPGNVAPPAAPPASTPAPVAPAPVTPASDLATLSALMLQAVQIAGYPIGSWFNYDQWNFFYQQMRGVYAPAFEDVMGGLDRNYRMSLDEWLQRVRPFGVSGLRRRF